MFNHLHVHSEFSLLDGAIRIDDLVKKAVEHKQSAVAITDHGWIAGSVKFQEAAKKAGIKSIIGMETYIASGDNHLDAAKNGGDNFHLTLLAKNRDGYMNLMRLTSLAHIEGFSYKPRISHDLLDKYKSNIIVLSGCVGAPIPQAIVRSGWKSGLLLAQWYQKMFGENFYIEVMAHGSTNGIDHIQIEEKGAVTMSETDLNMALVMIADKLGIGVVATNDAHYLQRDHGTAHDAMLCIGMGAWLEKPDRMRFSGAEHKAWEFYIKSESEMLAMSPEPWWQTACANTAIIADSIEANVVPVGESILPSFQIPNDPEFREWLVK